AYRPREKLTRIFDNKKHTKESGRRAIRRWMAEVRESGLNCFVSLRQKCMITAAICASQKIADNEGPNMIENRQCLDRASESIVRNHGRS
ncbi:MAG: hypothetical protein ACRD5H_11175, partial [Nitrososphaerales archaeon]